MLQIPVLVHVSWHPPPGQRIEQEAASLQVCSQPPLGQLSLHVEPAPHVYRQPGNVVRVQVWLHVAPEGQSH